MTICADDLEMHRENGSHGLQIQGKLEEKGGPTAVGCSFSVSKSEWKDRSLNGRTEI